jgi:solute carrier family 25 iron transporter 28/37
MQVLRPHPEAIYKDSFDALKSAARSQEGLRRLWRGVWSVVIGAGPAHALYFGSYEQAKKLLVPANSDAASSPFAVGISGAIATSLADGFMTPFDVIKQRMQVHDSPFTSVYRCGLEIFRREGLSAFFISYPTTLFLNIPFQMVQFPTYEFLRKLLHRDRDYDPVSHIVSGGLAGGLAAAVTTPIDVVKTTLQTRGLSTVEGDQLGKVGGMRDAVKFIHRERGWSGFTRGLGPRMLTHMPATAICWGFYEYLKSVLEIKSSA